MLKEAPTPTTTFRRTGPVKFNKLAEKAKQALDRRGGMDALKEDLQEVKQAATGRGSIRDKARAAADALKTPGRNPAAGSTPDAAGTPGAAGTPDAAARPVTPPPAAAPADPNPPAA
jgi:hypothetical protein